MPWGAPEKLGYRVAQNAAQGALTDQEHPFTGALRNAVTGLGVESMAKGAKAAYSGAKGIVRAVAPESAESFGNKMSGLFKGKGAFIEPEKYMGHSEQADKALRSTPGFKPETGPAPELPGKWIPKNEPPIYEVKSGPEKWIPENEPPTYEFKSGPEKWVPEGQYVRGPQQYGSNFEKDGLQYYNPKGRFEPGEKSLQLQGPQNLNESPVTRGFLGEPIQSEAPTPGLQYYNPKGRFEPGEKSLQLQGPQNLNEASITRGSLGEPIQGEAPTPANRYKGSDGSYQPGEKVGFTQFPPAPRKIDSLGRESEVPENINMPGEKLNELRQALRNKMQDNSAAVGFDRVGAAKANEKLTPLHAALVDKTHKLSPEIDMALKEQSSSLQAQKYLKKLTSPESASGAVAAATKGGARIGWEGLKGVGREMQYSTPNGGELTSAARQGPQLLSEIMRMVEEQKQKGK
jgi:hypothetical protein